VEILQILPASTAVVSPVNPIILPRFSRNVCESFFRFLG